MTILERTYDIDDIQELIRRPGNEGKRFELIDGELLAMAPANLEHSWLAIEIGYYIREYLFRHDLGRVGADSGHYTGVDRITLFFPDVAFTSHARLANQDPKKFASQMPDLAVEVQSPSNTLSYLRHKADIFLHNGTQLVWIVLPDKRSVEVHRRGADGSATAETISEGSALNGDPVLPGFSLPLTALFSVLDQA